MTGRRAPALLALLVLLAAPRAVLADAYEETMASALAKYGRVEAVPYDSVAWIARTYDRPLAQVRRDMAALPAPTPPAPPEAAAATPATTGFALPAGLDHAALETWTTQSGLPPWSVRAARGLLALLLIAGAIPLWAAPRGLTDASPHVRTASLSTGALPRLVALYLLGAGLWEVAGACDPPRFELARWVTVVREVGPPIRDAVRRLPIFQR